MSYLLEHWKPVVGYEGLYEVSNTGAVCRVRQSSGLSAWSRLKPSLRGSKRDYLYVCLCKDGVCKGFSIHRLVGKMFLGQLPAGLHTNHKNGWKRCNWLSNLE